MDINHMKQHRITNYNNYNNNAETVAFGQSIGGRMSAMPKWQESHFAQRSCPKGEVQERTE
jgi:hypothetical protein